MSEVEEVTEEPFLPPTPGATVMIPVAVRTVVALARIGGGAGLPAAAGKVGGAVDDLRHINWEVQRLSHLNDGHCCLRILLL